jgi:C1A family cysteine protease
VGLGWVPDLPDHRDETLTHVVRKKTKALGKPYDGKLKLASRAELDPDLLPPIQDQGALESCTAHAVIAMLEYLQRSAGADIVELSRLFLYKATRDYMGVSGDVGAYLRDTIKSAGLFGIPPEDRFPYVAEILEVEPAAFLYAYATNYKALNYVRLDDESHPDRTIANTKRVLLHQLPVALGFTIYSNMTNAEDIPLPGPQDKVIGGHAVLAVGYDDNHRVEGKKVPSLKIRNSWGAAWGDEGYGWLPYSYITRQLACDFWTCFKFDWPRS